MTLAIDLINRAFRLIGNNKFGDSGDASEYTDALESLNDMIADWSLTEGLLQYRQVQESYTFSSSVTSITVGATGDLVTSYTAKIVSPYLRVGSIDYPMTMMNSQEYADIALKSLVGGYPEYAYYDIGTTNGTLYLYPGASSGQTLYFDAIRPLQIFTGLQDTVTIPSHYNRAIAFNLAMEIAAEYGQEVSRLVAITAANTKRKIKQANFMPSVMDSEAAALSNGTRFNVNTGR